MDWIEEVIGKWREKIRNTSLRRSMVAIMTIALLGALVLNIMLRNICYGWINVISMRYALTDVDMNIEWQIHGMSTAEIQLLILKILYHYGLVLLVIMAGIIGIRYFFRYKLMPDVNAASEAAGYLILGDYGHEPKGYGRGEMGELCDRIEMLRKQLVEEKRREWDIQQEQSEINAAFAHDMRTPITVMKGYTEFLLKYVPQQKVSEEMLTEKLGIILSQQDRLLEFSKTMTEIQNMEMRSIHCVRVEVNELIKEITQTGEQLGRQAGLGVTVQTEMTDQSQISVDKSLILEITENLITNALRYAKQKVLVQIALKDHRLCVYVKDDGPGFSDKALRAAKNLYFSEAKTQGNHFGMGLYICEKLCEKHGGKMTIINGVEGGAIAAAEVRIIH